MRSRRRSSTSPPVPATSRRHDRDPEGRGRHRRRPPSHAGAAARGDRDRRRPVARDRRQLPARRVAGVRRPRRRALRPRHRPSRGSSAGMRPTSTRRRPARRRAGPASRPAARSVSLRRPLRRRRPRHHAHDRACGERAREAVGRRPLRRRHRPDEAGAGLLVPRACRQARPLLDERLRAVPERLLGRDLPRRRACARGGNGRWADDPRHRQSRRAPALRAAGVPAGPHHRGKRRLRHLHARRGLSPRARVGGRLAARRDESPCHGAGVAGGRQARVRGHADAVRAARRGADLPEAGCPVERRDRLRRSRLPRRLRGGRPVPRGADGPDRARRRGASRRRSPACRRRA